MSASAATGAGAATVPGGASQAASAVNLQSAGLTRVDIPTTPTTRPQDAQRKLPKKTPKPLQPPRNMEGGRSSLATGPVANGRESVDAIFAEGNESHAHASLDGLAHRNGFVFETQVPESQVQGITGEAGPARVYLETDRWEDHIKPHHIENPPEQRGKGMTTWWPVIFTSNGIQTMNEAQVQQMIFDAVRDGVWQNAPRGTMLAVYEVPEAQAIDTGVSEVKVSMAPDGRVLSAYPSAGANVLAVKEMPQEQQAAPQAQENPLDVAAEMKQAREAAPNSVV